MIDLPCPLPNIRAKTGPGRGKMCGNGSSPTFRDFRFTWRGFFKWTAATLLGVILGAAVHALFPGLEPDARARRRAGSPIAPGREMRIDGNLSVKLFTWQPSCRCRRRLCRQSQMGRARRKPPRPTDLRIEVRLVPLFWGHLVVPLVRIDQPDILVVRDADGRTNWDRADAGPNEAYKLPPIQRFLVNDGHVKIDDAVRKLHFTGTVVVGGKSRRRAFGLHPERRRHAQQQQVPRRCQRRAADQCG